MENLPETGMTAGINPVIFWRDPIINRKTSQAVQWPVEEKPQDAEELEVSASLKRLNHSHTLAY